LPIDNQTSTYPDEHIGILQQFEILLEMMQLERHLPTLSVDEDKVAVVAVGLYVDNFIHSHTHQHCRCFDFKPFHVSSYYLPTNVHKNCGFLS
jgi:hypothetical protein